VLRTCGRWLCVVASALLTACASYSGAGLKPGVAQLPDVLALMGPPALRWQDADGSVQLAYARGPAGLVTYMVRLQADGRLQGIDMVLDEDHFAQVRAGLGKDAVLRLIGPPDARRSMYFAARDELAWEWRFRDVYGKAARYIVLFDASADRVRSTMILQEDYRLHDFR